LSTFRKGQSTLTHGRRKEKYEEKIKGSIQTGKNLKTWEKVRSKIPGRETLKRQFKDKKERSSTTYTNTTK